MQIVIDIPEGLYKATVNGLDADEIWDLRLAVKNGTPLPKGHGVSALDKIRAEIKDASHGKWYVGRLDGKSEEVLLLDEVLQIIDKYKGEGENND